MEHNHQYTAKRDARGWNKKQRRVGACTDVGQNGIPRDEPSAPPPRGVTEVTCEVMHQVLDQVTHNGIHHHDYQDHGHQDVDHVAWEHNGVARRRDVVHKVRLLPLRLTPPARGRLEEAAGFEGQAGEVPRQAAQPGGRRFHGQDDRKRSSTSVLETWGVFVFFFRAAIKTVIVMERPNPPPGTCYGTQVM